MVNGSPSPTWGISPQVAKKRFATEVAAAARGTTDLGEARRVGAEAIAAQSNSTPVSAGLSGADPITIVLMEYTWNQGTWSHSDATPDGIAAMSVQVPVWSRTELDVMRIGLGFVLIITFSRIAFLRPTGEPTFPVGIARVVSLKWVGCATPCVLRGTRRTPRRCVTRRNGSFPSRFSS